MLTLAGRIYKPHPLTIQTLLYTFQEITEIEQRRHITLSPVSPREKPLVITHTKSSKKQLRQYIESNALVCIHNKQKYIVIAIRSYGDYVYLARKCYTDYSLLVYKKADFFEELNRSSERTSDLILHEMLRRVVRMSIEDISRVDTFKDGIHYSQASQIVGWDWESCI